MDNVTFQDITDPLTNVAITYAIIDRGNGEYTSMLKADYEALLAANSAPQTPTA